METNIKTVDPMPATGLITLDESGKLIEEIDAIDGLRNLGLDTFDSVKEVIDNSIDAKATKIAVHVFEEDSDISIVVEDNGVGMLKADIAKNLGFGHRKKIGKNSIGRFGWGLSAAACCQTTLTQVYSKTDGIWYMAEINLNEAIKNKSATIQPAKQMNPPEKLNLLFKDSKTGTVVYFVKCDNTSLKTASGIASHLKKDLGETYRKYLQTKEIWVCDDKNNVKLIPVDPLMLIHGCKDSDKIGNAHEFKKIEPIIFPDIVDPETKEPAKITIKVVHMNKIKMMEKTGLSGIKLAKDYGFNQPNQGLYLLRNNRQIARGLKEGIYKIHNDLNYFRAEISFPICLDSLFGINTNKSTFNMKQPVRDKLEDVFDPVVEACRAISKGWQQDEDEVKGIDGETQAEKAANEADKKFFKPREYKPTKQEIEKVKNELKDTKAKLKDDVRKSPDIDKKEIQKRLRDIENKISNKFGYFMKVKNLPSGTFYVPQPGQNEKGEELNMVYINDATQFYYKIYEKAAQKNAHVYIRLFILMLAMAEIKSMHMPEKKRFYENERREWTTYLETMLDLFEDIEKDV